MADNNEGIFSPVFEGELNIESIISAPLVAASKANVMILTGQANFLLNYCFEETEGMYRPKMVEMLLTQPVVDHTKDPAEPGYITVETMGFQVPLVCLLPINSIAIDNVTVNFDLEITSVGSYTSNIDLFEKKAVLNGRIAPAEKSVGGNADERYDRQAASRLNVDIHVGRLPLPKGILSILDLYTKAIQPISKKAIKDSKL